MTNSADSPPAGNNDEARWQISGVTPEARQLARDTAQRNGIGVGDWLDAVIRRRTGLAANDALDTLPADLLDTLEGLEARVAARASEVETLLEPIGQSVENLTERLQSFATDAEAPPDDRMAETDATGDDGAAPDAPFFSAEAPPSDDDQQIADATVAAEIDKLLDDGGPATKPAGPGLAAPRRGTDSTGSRRSMFVAAAIVVVLVAIGITVYQWAVVPTTPRQETPSVASAPAPVRETVPANTGSDAAPTMPVEPSKSATEPPAPQPGTEKVDLETLEPEQEPAPDNAGTTAQDPSFTRPAPPNVAAGSPVAAVYAGAVAGEARAQYDLAIDYITGNRIATDYAAAAYWLREAAEQGLPPAQYNLGVVYDIGLAGRQDPVEALLWFNAAAEQGHGRANYALGLAYAEGKGVPRDDRLALVWFRKAADAGVADAQLALGIMFEQGLGTTANPARAYYWYRRAEIGGNERAAGRIAALGDKLDSATRAKLNDAVSRDVTPELALEPTNATPAMTAPADATASPAPSPRQPPSDKETVRAVQRLLADFGFDPGPADGDAGPRTRAAIEEYQRALDLPVDGRASPALLAHLREVAGLPPGR